jgi:hypothetical protein
MATHFRSGDSSHNAGARSGLLNMRDLALQRNVGAIGRRWRASPCSVAIILACRSRELSLKSSAFAGYTLRALRLTTPRRTADHGKSCRER